MCSANSTQAESVCVFGKYLSILVKRGGNIYSVRRYGCSNGPPLSASSEPPHLPCVYLCGEGARALPRDQRGRDTHNVDPKMNGGLDLHIMKDRFLIGSVFRWNIRGHGYILWQGVTPFKRKRHLRGNIYALSRYFPPDNAEFFAKRRGFRENENANPESSTDH